MKSHPLILATLLALASCTATSVAVENPPAAGFDTTHSDARAIAIADEVMHALGGREAWDRARCIRWTFAGKRSHLWDKHTGDYRFDDGKMIVLMNLSTGQGRVFEAGVEITRDPDKAREALDRAYKTWVNDSYWLCAPYKLKDSGVRLTHAGVRALADGRPADVLRLEFQAVGVTPDNAYEMWVAQDSRLVEQWAFFQHKDDREPKMTTPWANWKRYGDLMFASDHGKGPSTTDITVFDAPQPALSRP